MTAEKLTFRVALQVLSERIHQAFLNYPGNLYVSEYSNTGKMASAIAIATAAFADGETVTCCHGTTRPNPTEFQDLASAYKD